MTDAATSPPVLAPGEHFAEINGFTMHYTVRGTGPLLLLPASGWGPAVSYLLPMPVLEQHCTVVYFDTRRSGGSTGPEDPAEYTLEHFVADIDALRMHLGADRVFLAGHSGGGHQALAYGIEHSDHLLGILAIDAIVAADAARSDRMMRRIEERWRQPDPLAAPDSVDDAMRLMRDGAAGRRPTIEQVLDATVAFYFHDPEQAGDVFRAMEFDDAVLGYTETSGFQNRNLLPDLFRITVPTLLVYGGDHDFQGARAHAVMPTARLEIIQEAGHLPWIEQPLAFDAAFAAWFESLQR